MSEYELDAFRCKYCAKKFLTKDDADRHYLEVHIEEETTVLE
jgi:hypothetical protein